jgi:TolB-like protein
VNEASANDSAARPAIAVLAVETTGIDAGHVAPLSEVLTTELTALGRFEVISARDIQAMLEHEANKQAMGCNDAACFAEIGGALGADNLLIPQVSRLEDTFVVNIKLIDVKQARILRRVSERVDDDFDDVLEAIRYSIGALMDPDAGEGIVRGRPLVSTVPLVLGGVSVAALATGIAFGLKANTHYTHATDPTYAGGQLEVDDGKDAQLIANISFATSAAAAIVGTLLFLLWDTELFASTTVTPSLQGAGGAVTITF